MCAWLSMTCVQWVCARSGAWSPQQRVRWKSSPDQTQDSISHIHITSRIAQVVCSFIDVHSTCWHAQYGCDGQPCRVSYTTCTACLPNRGSSTLSTAVIYVYPVVQGRRAAEQQGACALGWTQEAWRCRCAPCACVALAGLHTLLSNAR